MKLSFEEANRHSEDEFGHKLRVLASSGAGVIHVRTSEIMRAVIAVREAVLTNNGLLHEWNITKGMVEYTLDTMYSVHKDGNNDPNIGNQIAEPLKEAAKDDLDTDRLHYYVFVNPQYWLDNNPAVAHHIQQASFALPATNTRIVLLTPDMPLPPSVADCAVMLRLTNPGLQEMRGYLDDIIEGADVDGLDDIDEEDRDRICMVGAGMSKEAFEMYASVSITDKASENEDAVVTAEDIVQGINIGKTEVVNKNDILELYPSEDMDHVGGMENLKDWVRRRKNCYSDEAVDFGIEPPKGMVFVGPPGTGKSLVSKAVANELGVPLVRLDFGRIFNSLVGASEERVRTALRMVESMSPVVLFVDEIDKGLGGIGSSGDSGTSSRVLGTFLTWLQENKRPVFTMVTANNVTGLPPELLRRGRFDAIFSTGLPDQKELQEVIRIHLAKRGYEMDDEDVRDIAVHAKSYVPAEVESAIKDGLINAFSDGEDFGADHVIEALASMVPLSQAFNEQIQAMTVWAKQNATPAGNIADVPEVDNKVSAIGPRRVRGGKKGGKGKKDEQ